VGAGPAREREQSSRQDSRDLYCSGGRSFVSETRCNGGAFRDRSSRPWPLLVWPSLAKQLPPGTTIAPLTRQRHRHGSEHRLDLSTKCGLWRRISQGAPGSGGPVQDRVWPGMAKAVRRPTEPCMFNTDEQLRLSTSYRGGRLSLEAVLTDLVCRVAPRLITNLEEYQEAGLAGLRIARSRQYQVRGRGTGGYCGIDVDARGRV
jgi:hypothetical protein